MTIKRFWRLARFHGFDGLIHAVHRRVIPPKAQCFPLCADLVTGRSGLEIGGPSSAFKRSGLLPIYPLIGQLDNCNFGNQTIWEGAIQEGLNFVFDDNHSPGHQFIAEAADLSRIKEAAYQFVLSSHVLEHLANPLKALLEWNRVLKDDGVLIVIVPHREGTFDHRRPITTISHLLADLENNTQEDDTTHLPEILALHDLDIHPGGCEFSTFKQRSERNLENRCLHHHVFNMGLLAQVVDRAGFQIRALEAVRPFHIIVVGQKVRAGSVLQNDSFLKGSDAAYLDSPFYSDRNQGMQMSANASSTNPMERRGR
jgi:SAM-dependent methyltransferase